jgi:hypothetical protein
MAGRWSTGTCCSEIGTTPGMPAADSTATSELGNGSPCPKSSAAGGLAGAGATGLFGGKDVTWVAATWVAATWAGATSAGAVAGDGSGVAATGGAAPAAGVEVGAESADCGSSTAG